MADPRPFPILRAAGTTALFVIGIVTGVLSYQRLTATEIDYGPFPPRTEAAEPEAADTFTDLVLAGNDARLATEYDADVLQQLSMALALGTRSMVDIADVRYLGSVSEGTDTLANYVAIGKLADDTDVVLSFAVRIQNGTVVGVN